MFDSQHVLTFGTKLSYIIKLVWNGLVITESLQNRLGSKQSKSVGCHKKVISVITSVLCYAEQRMQSYLDIMK